MAERDHARMESRAPVGQPRLAPPGCFEDLSEDLRPEMTGSVSQPVGEMR